MSIYSILALFLIFLYLCFIGVRGIIRAFRDGKMAIDEKRQVLLQHVDGNAIYNKFAVMSLREVDAFGQKPDGSKDSQKAGDMFERYVCKLFISLGNKAYLSHDYAAMKGIRIDGFDGGADVIVEEIGASGEVMAVVAVQCKHYTDNVDAKAVDAAATSAPLYRANRSAVITNVGYTKAAIQKADVNNVKLYGRKQLAQMIARAGKVPLTEITGDGGDSEQEVDDTFEKDDEGALKPSFDN